MLSIKTEVVNATASMLGKPMAPRSGENNVERAAATPSVVDTPTDIASVIIVSYTWQLINKLLFQTFH